VAKSYTLSDYVKDPRAYGFLAFMHGFLFGVPALRTWPWNARYDAQGREMDFEGGHTRDLLTLAQRALQGDKVDKGMLCSAAIRVIDNPPRDGILRSLADHVCQAVFDWACFDGSPARLEGVIEGYRMAANALEIDDKLNKLQH
jgi:hypothetical protein